MRTQVFLWISLISAALMSCHPAPADEVDVQPDTDLGPRALGSEQAIRAVREQNFLPASMPSPEPAEWSPQTSTPGLRQPAPARYQEWNSVGPGPLQVPILLYHHVDPERPAGSFNVDPEQFEEQIRALVKGGFQSIPTLALREAILHGAPMPPKPVVITFDDGNQTDYTYAFPILQEYGFQAVVYMVANRLGSTGFLSAAQLSELSAAGWEIGSHSMTHADLATLSGRELGMQVVGSKAQLEQNLRVEITSFAYPYGSFSPEVAERVRSAGYQTAMGLGMSTLQGSGNLYYLSRIPVEGSWSLDQFIRAVGRVAGR